MRRPLVTLGGNGWWLALILRRDRWRLGRWSPGRIDGVTAYGLGWLRLVVFRH